MCQSMCTHTSHFVTDKGEDNPGIQSYNCLIVATPLGVHVVRVVICFFSGTAVLAVELQNTGWLISKRLWLLWCVMLRKVTCYR